MADVTGLWSGGWLAVMDRGGAAKPARADAGAVSAEAGRDAGLGDITVGERTTCETKSAPPLVVDR